MLRNLEKNVIFRAIITKKIIHKSKKKKKRFPLSFTSCFRVSLSAQAIVQIFGRFKMVPFPFTSQRYYQFSRFILQYNKMHHIQLRSMGGLI